MRYIRRGSGNYLKDGSVCAYQRSTDSIVISRTGLAPNVGRIWPTKGAARLAVGDWIERVYNRRRRHSALGMISPVEFENRLTRSAQAA